MRRRRRQRKGDLNFYHFRVKTTKEEQAPLVHQVQLLPFQTTTRMKRTRDCVNVVVMMVCVA